VALEVVVLLLLLLSLLLLLLLLLLLVLLVLRMLLLLLLLPLLLLLLLVVLLLVLLLLLSVLLLLLQVLSLLVVLLVMLLLLLSVLLQVLLLWGGLARRKGRPLHARLRKCLFQHGVDAPRVNGGQRRGSGRACEASPATTVRRLSTCRRDTALRCPTINRGGGCCAQGGRSRGSRGCMQHNRTGVPSSRGSRGCMRHNRTGVPSSRGSRGCMWHNRTRAPSCTQCSLGVAKGAALVVGRRGGLGGIGHGRDLGVGCGSSRRPCRRVAAIVLHTA